MLRTAHRSSARCAFIITSHRCVPVTSGSPSLFGVIFTFDILVLKYSMSSDAGRRPPARTGVTSAPLEGTAGSRTIAPQEESHARAGAPAGRLPGTDDR